MVLHRFVAAFTFALLVPAFFVLPSCSDPACTDGGEGCPCTTGLECGRPPACTGWMCDGTCHSFNERVGFRCMMDSCAGPDKCPGVCDGAGTCIGCLQDADCKPGHTCEAGNVCSSCSDGVKNGDETEIDCGGSCPLCPGTCNIDADCPGGYCWEGLCARCDDGIQNGDETDVDCGGSCSLCPGTCNVDADCSEGYCWEGLCVRCDDGIQNGDETGVDCGSVPGHCPLCTGYLCKTDEQCATGICAANGVCCKVVCDGCQQCDFGSGECHPIAGPIPWADCVPGQLCGLGGMCAWKDGYPCTKNEDCFNLACTNGICGF